MYQLSVGDDVEPVYIDELLVDWPIREVMVHVRNGDGSLEVIVGVDVAAVSLLTDNASDSFLIHGPVQGPDNQRMEFRRGEQVMLAITARKFRRGAEPDPNTLQS